MKCAKCGALLPEASQVCPECAYPVMPEDVEKSVEEPKKEATVARLHFGRKPEKEETDWELPVESLMANNETNDTIEEMIVDANKNSEDQEALETADSQFVVGDDVIYDSEGLEPEKEPELELEEEEEEGVEIPNVATEAVAEDVEDLAATRIDDSFAKPRHSEPKPEKPESTRKLGLGQSPLEEEPIPTAANTSDELKRVLQTIFSTDNHKPVKPKSAPLKKDKLGKPDVTLDDQAHQKTEEPAWANTAASEQLPPAKNDTISADLGEMSDEKKPEPAFTMEKSEKPAAEPRKPMRETIADRISKAEISPPGSLAIQKTEDLDEEDEKVGEQLDFELSSKNTPEESIELEPSPVLEEEISEMHVIVAGFLRRLIAGIIDHVVTIVLMGLFMFAALTAFGAERLPDLGGGIASLIALARDYPTMFPMYVALYLFLYTVLVLYFSITSGQTPGASLMDLRTIQTDGGRMGLFRACVRLIGSWLAFAPIALGYLWILIDSRKQGLHDKMAQTLVTRVQTEQWMQDGVE